MILLSLYCSFLSSTPCSPFVFSYPYGIFVCLKEKCHFEERSFNVRVWKSCGRPHYDDGCLGAGWMDVLAILHLTT